MIHYTKHMFLREIVLLDAAEILKKIGLNLFPCLHRGCFEWQSHYQTATEQIVC